MAATLYYVQDDTAGGTVLAGGSGAQLSPEFASDTLAHAQSLAQIYATLFQRQVRLVPKGGTGPYTLYTPGASGSALGSGPTGISF